MILRICSFSERGSKLAKRIADLLPEDIVEVREGQPAGAFAGEAFSMNAPLIFIGAAGIAVRTIAPFVQDKLTDSPVLVIDEKGRFVIPVLSGHVGGANELAVRLGGLLCATPVITTATDVNGLFSVDVFAGKNWLKILNREGIRLVSSKLLKKGRISVALDSRIKVRDRDVPGEIRVLSYEAEEGLCHAADTDADGACGREIWADVLISEDCETGRRACGSSLQLAPKKLVLGIGCRKGASCEQIGEFVDALMEQCGYRWEDVAAIATIDLKKKEYGLVKYAQVKRVPLFSFSNEELDKAEGEFEESAFVQSVTGVSNVCERAAMYWAGSFAGSKGRLVLKKQKGSGVTLAVAERKAVIISWNT